jgi:CTP:molybdopterin cytidylyltransferase MocA
MSTGSVYALVLAAGTSQRFGDDKLLALLDGKPILSHVLDTLQKARERGLIDGGVVVTRSTKRVEDLIARTDFMLIDNPDPEAGLSRSLQLGLGSLMTNFVSARGALVCTGDQPRLQLTTIESVVTAWSRGERPVARPRYLEEKESPGHPVLIGRKVWGLATTLRGDVGFGAMLKQHPDMVTTVDVPGTNPDIDTSDDLRRLAERA